MIRTRMAAVVAAGMLVMGGAPASPAMAQADKVPVEKGVKTSSLVTSLGPFRQVTSVPMVMTGQVVEIAPGGQTGRERTLVPSFLYVLQGTLTTDTEAGPIGIAGIQYHSEGQSYAEPTGIWHNYSNTGQTPVKYILLFLGTPGTATSEKAKADD
jgi:quercetin dioxygenase-like cupin family protein